MSGDLSFSLAALGSVFSIVDPFAALPIFIGLTGASGPEAQRRAGARAALTCLIVLSVFATAGNLLFKFFGITIPAFRIAGGILLFFVALEMLRAERSRTKTTSEEERDAAAQSDVGIVPLGIPLLSGPGAIATVMMLSGSAATPVQHAAVYVVIVVVAFASYVVFRFAARTARFLGTTGMHLIGRIMGLILAALAVQFVLDGVLGALPGLGRAP
ncbi:MAG: NAAT family transporter [Polyangiaceae bacterium]|nr:NAAT family transporter [Polyangiaceae bacterium]